MSSSYRRLYAVFGAGALLGLSVGVRADNWEVLPRIEAGGLWNDNYRLGDVPGQKAHVYGPYVDAQLSMDLLSPASKLDITPRVHSTFFPTDHADQSNDGYLDIDGEHKTLRSDFTGVLQYANEEVFYSDYLPATFPGLALGQASTAPSGRITVSTRQQLARAAPQYEYDLTQRTHLNLNADLDHVTYSQSQVQQIGYNSYTGAAGVGFDVSPRSVFTVRGVGTHFAPQAGGDNTNTYGAQAEWDLRRSQIARFYARLGVDRTSAQTSVGTVTTSGVTGGVGVDLRYQINEITVDALRSVIPSSQGIVMTDEELRFRALHAFYPRLSGFVGARAMRLTGASSRAALAVTTETYATAEAGFDYQITQSYRVEGAYDFAWQQFPGSPTATSNAIRLAIIYQPLSRFEPLPEFTGIPPKER
jgi:hypothetical protein